MKIRVGIADDHQLFARSLGLMLENFQRYETVLLALNGKDLQQKMMTLSTPPDLILLDVNMPIMNGVETAGWLQQHYPSVKTIALSMNDDDKSIIGMIKAGCCAYLLKDVHPDELEKALDEIHTKGYYNADAMNINYRRLILIQQKEEELQITDKEKTFLQFACTDMTYKQIASEMNLAERTIDGYRENLFRKFNVQSRVGLAMEAIRKGWVSL